MLVPNNISIWLEFFRKPAVQHYQFDDKILIFKYYMSAIFIQKNAY